MAKHFKQDVNEGAGAGVSLAARLAWSVVPLVVLCACYCALAWMVGHSFDDGGPDESARMLVPKAILMGNLLPSGTDPVTIERWGGYSYAFYPQVIGAYVTAAFEYVAGLVGASTLMKLYAARLSSVMWALIGVFFLGKSVRTIYAKRADRHVVAACAMLFMGFWPQFAFLASYVNNDVIAVAGTSILLCALITGIRNEWRGSSCAMLVGGIVVCALGYLNTYGFIAMAVVAFVVTCVRQNTDDRSRAARLVGLSALACALLTFPFYGVCLMRYGDPLGTRAFEEQYRQWVAQTGTELMHPFEGGLKGLLVSTDFYRTTADSYVGVFGYMRAYMPLWCRLFFGGVAGLSVVVCVLNGKTRKALFGSTWRLLVLCMLVAAVLTMFMHLWRSATVDYQPQGRYIIPTLVPLCLLVAVALASVFRNRSGLAVAFMLVVAAISVAGACSVMVEFGWTGFTTNMQEYAEWVIPRV